MSTLVREWGASGPVKVLTKEEIEEIKHTITPILEIKHYYERWKHWTAND